jgi:hypothetical protein
MTLGFFGIPPQFLYIASCYHYYVHEENKICMYVCIMLKHSYLPNQFAHRTVVPLVKLAVGEYEFYKPSIHLNVQVIHWVNHIKYLGSLFNVASHLAVDATCLKTKFFAAMNSVLTTCQCADEFVTVQLTESFCLPLLVY